MAIQNFPTGAQPSEKSLFSGQGFGEAQVFTPNYDGLIAMKNRPIIEKENKRGELINSISGLKGALPGQAEDLQRQKKAFWDKVNDGVSQNKHLDQSWLQQIYGEADFLKEAYTDSNNNLNIANKTLQEIISNPNEFTQESLDKFNSIFKPETFSQFQGNIPAGSLYVQNAVSGLQKKPKELKPEYWFDNANIKTAKAKLIDKKYTKDGSGSQKDLIDYDALEKDAKLDYMKMTPGEKLSLLEEAGGDDKKAHEILKQNRLSAIEKMQDNTTVVTKEEKTNSFSANGRTVPLDRFALSRALDANGNYIQRIAVESKGKDNEMFIPVTADGKKKTVFAKFVGYKLDESKGKWEALYQVTTPIEGEKIEGTNKYKIDYDQNEISYPLDSNEDFMDINNKSQLISGVDWKNLPVLSKKLAEMEGYDLEKAMEDAFDKKEPKIDPDFEAFKKKQKQ